ncbi:maleylacetate reductase and hydroxyquinol 1,2-dioxygenase domain-containing protein [Rugosimonospora acidiphila]|uniref:Maleylacetate reductase and hydroxyquinol 1,2-dioxygenase domain-containing protein n=1 Tax=Rugosimonospora acidiphila TaxID=556531 RepID=A0ABP9RR98_9ACTN
MRSFAYSSHPIRVLFGAGTLRQLPDEVRRLGGTRVLLLARSQPGEAARAALGALCVAQFTDATMHTPVEVTERALAMLREHGADCLVSVGGGTSTGLGKALSVRTGLPHLAVPTTYAGSEVTPVLGETGNGGKTTRSAPAILPETVLYDVELTLALPVPVSVTSGVNAMAHAVEALYSPDANPVIDGFATRAIAGMAAALPRIAQNPSDVDARADALMAAWLAGTCLAGAGMGLHHKLCHILGGTFDLPHAQTHTVVLPHAMAYNAPTAPDAMRRIAEALGTGDAAAGMFDLIASLGGPTSLRALGLPEAELSRAALLANAGAESSPYPNPREVTVEGVERLLRDAWAGQRPEPAAGAAPDLGWLTRQVVDSFAGSPNGRVGELLTDLVRHLHEFVRHNDLTEEEWLYAIDFLTRTGQISGPKRQEFVLLSDTLGVSSVVDMLTNSRTPQTTPSAVLGPFYVPGPPAAPAGADISAGLPGTPLWVDVRVVNPDGEPIEGATVDVWQSNEDGFYDVQLPDLEGPALRARFESDAEGRIRFWSILPSEYPIPKDGPVGQMLDAVGRHPYRAPHLHFMIWADGYRRLVTQLFVAGGAYLDSDTVFGVKNGLVVDFKPGNGPAPDGREVDGPWHLLEFTFRIAPA